MAIGDLRAILKENGLVEGRSDDELDGDYHIRPDIEEIELIPRTPKRFSILLPERKVLKGLQTQNSSELRMATIYADVKPDDVVDLNSVPAHGRATYRVILEGEDKFSKFLEPYMASYMCTQCR